MEERGGTSPPPKKEEEKKGMKISKERNALGYLRGEELVEDLWVEPGIYASQ